MGFVSLQEGFALDPIEELKSFSGFSAVDLQSLAEGNPLVERGDLMDFPRGVSAEACYVVMVAPAKAVQFYRAWDASHHEELKLYAHLPIHSPPADDDFKRLDLHARKISWLVDKTEAISPERFDLQLSMQEAVQVFESMKKDGKNVETALHLWKDLLKARALRFQKEGMEGTMAYEMGGSAIKPASEVKNLLNEVPKILAQFAPFLDENLLAKQSFPSASSPQYYWELLEIDRHAAFNLGVIFLKELDRQRFQMADLTYYSSSGIYASFSLQQFWPVRINGREATLVWKGEFVSAPLMAVTQGMERMAASGLMEQELKKEIHFFCEDAEKSLEAPTPSDSRK